MIYFLAGIAIDVLITAGWYALERKLVFWAAVSSFAQTIVAYAILYDLILGGTFTVNLILYALGGAIGTAGVVTAGKYGIGPKLKLRPRLKRRGNKPKAGG